MRAFQRELALARQELGAARDVFAAEFEIEPVPVADALQCRNIPFVFNTAMADFGNLSARHNGAQICRKPARQAELARRLVRLTGTAAGALAGRSGRQ